MDQEFLSEAEELIETLGRELLRYEEAISKPGRVDPDILNGIFRAAHSLKGLSGMCGFTDLGRVSHSMENLLDRMRLGKVKPQPAVLDVLFSGVEGLKDLLEDTDEGKARLPKLVEAIEATAEGKAPVEPVKSSKKTDAPKKNEPAKKQKAPEENLDPNTVMFEGVAFPKSVIDVLTEYEEFRLVENIRSDTNIVKVHSKFDLTDFDIELPKLMEWLKSRGEVITTLPGGDTDSEHIHFDLLVGLDVAPETLDGEIKDKGFSMTVLKNKQGTVEAAPEEEEEAASESPDADEKIDAILTTAAESETDSESARSVSSTVRVDISRLDHLMNIVGELVLEKSVIGNIRDRLSQESGMRTLSNELYKAHRTLDRKLAELQEAVMDVRMVPIGQLFGRLGRIVRKLGREQGKDIELIKSGDETELDKLIIEELADPLMHIIRNAIDHGIESPAERAKRSKPAKGRIELHAYQQGNHVVIEVADDGNGIDAKKVKEKAVKIGMIKPGTELSEDEVYEYMFEPGFSTKDTVSEVSGRGVGLDVVRKNISMLSGLIEIESEPGEGTVFVLTLPITLAIIQALIVQCSGRTYALPLNSVRECHILTPDEIKTIEQREVMELRDQTIPLLRLAALFGYDKNGNGDKSKPAGDNTESKFNSAALEPVPEEFALDFEDEESEDRQFVVIIGIADKRMGVLVDRMLGRQDVVIKSLGKVLGDIPGVSGATDLGNQQTVLVLDVGDLLGEIGHSLERNSNRAKGV